MSMISGQCDELRDWACELRKLANGSVNEGFPARANLFDSADAMCQAADTIWELRETAQKANAENAKLRELVKALDWCTENTDLRSRCDECPLEQSDKLTPECEVRMRELRIGVDE